MPALGSLGIMLSFAIFECALQQFLEMLIQKTPKVKGVLTGIMQKISRRREICTIMWRLRESIARNDLKVHANRRIK